MKHLIVKTITHKNIHITYKIDFDRKEISLVQRSGDSFTPKQYVFAGRTMKYMPAWHDILDAMKLAIDTAQAELQAHLDVKVDELAKKLIAKSN